MPYHHKEYDTDMCGKIANRDHEQNYSFGNNALGPMGQAVIIQQLGKSIKNKIQELFINVR